MTIDTDNKEQSPQSPQSKGWTPARRAKHAAFMRFKSLEWKPWSFSTGPRTVEGKKRCSRNALKHGFRSAGARKFYALMTKHRRWLRAVEAVLNFLSVEDKRFANRLIEPNRLFPVHLGEVGPLLC